MLPPWLKILNDFPLHLNKAYTKPERLILSYRTLKGSCGLSNLSCTKFFLVSWNPLPPDLSIAGSYLSLRSQLYVTSLERSSLTNLTLSHSIMLKVFHFYIIQHPQIPSYLYLLFFSSPQNTSYTIITQSPDNDWHIEGVHKWMDKKGKHGSHTWDFYSPGGEDRKNGPQDGKGIWKSWEKNLKALRKFLLVKGRPRSNFIIDFKYLKR